MLESGYVIRALRRIEDSAQAPPHLAELSAAAGFSPFHFHRHFLRVMGETVGSYIRRTRLDAAAIWLGDSDESIMFIALAVGYESHEALTRAFKRRFGLAPYGYRKLIRSHADETTRQPPDPAANVQICRVAAAHLIGMRFFGPYGRVREFWTHFSRTLRQHGLDPALASPVGIRHDHPDITPPTLTRYDCCIFDTGLLADVRSPLCRYAYEDGSCATLRYEGAYDATGLARQVIVAHVRDRLHDRRIETTLSYERYHSPPWQTVTGQVSISTMIPIR